MVSQPENSGGLDSTSDVFQAYQLQEAETVASPQVTVVRQPDISGFMDRPSSVSQQKGNFWHSPSLMGFK